MFARFHTHVILKNSFSPLKNNSGMLAVDFLFSIILACILCMMLFAMSVTYVSIEVAQYVAFSAARAGAAADVDIDSQKARALYKLTGASRGNSALTPLLPNGPSTLKMFFNEEWFSLKLKDQKMGGNSSTGGNPSDSYEDEYPKDTFGDSNQFIPQVGLRLSYTAKIMNMRIAFLGGSGNNQGAGFNATITGFINREPTQKECMDLMSTEKRYKKILDLDPRFQGILSLNSVPDSAYVVMEDNGC